MTFTIEDCTCNKFTSCEDCLEHDTATRNATLDELWQFCLINGAEEHGDLIGMPKDPFFTLKLLKKIGEMRYESLRGEP